MHTEKTEEKIEAKAAEILQLKADRYPGYEGFDEDSAYAAAEIIVLGEQRNDDDPRDTFTPGEPLEITEGKLRRAGYMF